MRRCATLQQSPDNRSKRFQLFMTVAAHKDALTLRTFHEKRRKLKFIFKKEKNEAISNILVLFVDQWVQKSLRRNPWIFQANRVESFEKSYVFPVSTQVVDQMPRTLHISALVGIWLTLAGIGAAPLHAQTPSLPSPRYPDVPQQVETSGLEYITPKTERAIDRGLEYLASKQFLDGSFGSGKQYPQNVAVTALSGMAFLSAGHMPGRGRFGGNVQKATDFLLKNTDASGFINVEAGASHGPMYGHGFATLFLAEVYGMSPRKDIHQKLTLAVKLIVNSQNSEGGWRYLPGAEDADISVTVCQIMALRAARNAGISVPKETVDRCTKYVKACQNNNDGGFRYQLSHPGGSLFPRSAAALVALYSAGEYEGPEIERGLRYLKLYIPRRQRLRRTEYYFYGHYYAVQAMWHSGGDDWKQWYPAIRDDLLNQQDALGGWDNRLIGPEYSTAMALLVLQMPNNYLPIFQR